MQVAAFECPKHTLFPKQLAPANASLAYANPAAAGPDSARGQRRVCQSTGESLTPHGTQAASFLIPGGQQDLVAARLLLLTPLTAEHGGGRSALQTSRLGSSSLFPPCSGSSGLQHQPRDRPAP